jgi:hypothetical protein
LVSYRFRSRCSSPRYHRSLEQAEGSRNTAILQQGFAGAEAEIRPKLPLRLDESTILENVTHKGRTLIYSYRLDHKHDQTTAKDFVPAAKASVLDAVCKNDGSVKTLGLGASMRYIYSDLDGDVVASFDVNRNDCR